MYRVPPARAWWPAVVAPLERGVRRRRGKTHTDDWGLKTRLSKDDYPTLREVTKLGEMLKLVALGALPNDRIRIYSPRDYG